MATKEEKNMILSETEGRLFGIEYDSSVGLMLNTESYEYSPYIERTEVRLPWNRNIPQEINLDKLRGKKVRITLEIIEDEKEIPEAVNGRA